MNATVDALNALSIFGPGQAGAYREHAGAVRQVLGEDVPTKARAYVAGWARSGTAGTLILTGNAGTGKTALVEAYCEELGVPPPKEDAAQEVAERRFVVKDFSGVDNAGRDAILSLEAEIREGDDAQLLLCANEGVLRAALERRPDSDLEARLDQALQSGCAFDEGRDTDTVILNMNRQRWTAPALWARLLDYLVREELWVACDGCPAASRCPIRANAAALRRPGPREAVRHLFQLASGMAVATLREVLAVLAHGVTAGLSCADIKNAEGVSLFTAETGYFNLLLGAGLDAEQMERSALVEALIEAGIGETADIQVDGWLRDSGTAPSEIRDLAEPAEPHVHATVPTPLGAMTFGQLGETITVSDDAARVKECLRDFASGRNILGIWRRRLFFEVQSLLGGRSASFHRLSRFSGFGELLDLAEAIRRGADVAEERQRLILGLNYLAAGFYAFSGRLVVPDAGSLVARNPGSFRPPAPSLVHSRIRVESVMLSLEDGDALREALDTDDVRVVLEATTEHGTVARLVLTPRLYQAVRDSAEYRAPVGADIAEMSELASFYALLATDPVEPGLRIVDPALEVIREVTLPALER